MVHVDVGLNLAALDGNRDSSVLKSLDSSIKKNTAVVKKLKTITEENVGNEPIK